MSAQRLTTPEPAAGPVIETWVLGELGRQLDWNTPDTRLYHYRTRDGNEVDAVLEDWQHVAQYTQYATKQKSVKLEGSNGLTGHIGWFIPSYLLKQYPEFKTWKGLKGHEKVFASPEAPQGMFLGGDPSYQQKDKTLIKALGLNFKFVSVGAEPAQVARWTQLYKQGKPVLFYWYDPQYLNAKYKVDLIKLPARFKGCKDDEKEGGNPKAYACAYPSRKCDGTVTTHPATEGMTPSVQT